MVQKNVTLSLDEDLYEKYQRYCKDKGLALSRSIELFMENKMEQSE